MKIKNVLSILICLATTVLLYGQQPGSNPSLFDKTRLFGGSTYISWSKIGGSRLPETYFAKPTAGLILQAEYFLKARWGYGFGLGYQQKGAGIKNPDLIQELGNGDSTYRERIRFHDFELPVYLFYRSAEIGRTGTRFSSRLGASFAYNTQTAQIWHSVEDGFHDIQKRTQQYYRGGINLLCSAGLDINAGPASLFQLHFFYQRGLQNVFRDSATFNNSRGYTQLYGLQFCFLY
jgi:hypothetical protein